MEGCCDREGHGRQAREGVRVMTRQRWSSGVSRRREECGRSKELGQEEGAFEFKLGTDRETVWRREVRNRRCASRWTEGLVGGGQEGNL